MMCPTNVVTDEDGAVKEFIDYHAYGTERINWSSGDSGEAETQRTYIGEYSDDETQLSYLNARYYDAGRGQFLSQDLVFMNLGAGGNRDIVLLLDPQMMNSYLYGRGNPINLSDATGEIPEWMVQYLNSAAGASDIFFNGIASFVPIVSDARDIVGAIFGYDIITNNRLTKLQQQDYGFFFAVPFISGSLIHLGDELIGIKNVNVRNFGETIYSGSVNLTDTIKGVENGTLKPRLNKDGSIKFFQNNEGFTNLNYSNGNKYLEYDVVHSGAPSNSAERILVGTENGDLYSSPDHYETLIPVKK